MALVEALLFAAGAAALAGPAAVPPTRYGLALESLTIQGNTATGRCGPANIRVEGIERDDANDRLRLRADVGTITVENGAKRLPASKQYSDEVQISIDDQMMLWCLPTPTGPRLVFAIQCMAAACPPVDYPIVDPATVKLVGPYPDECDENCVKRLIGVAPPTMPEMKP